MGSAEVRASWPGHPTLPHSKEEEKNMLLSPLVYVMKNVVIVLGTDGFVGGFGSYLLGLNKRTYEQAGVDTEGNSPGSYKEPGIGWMTGFLFVVSFVGLLALVPLRKVCALTYISFVLEGFVLRWMDTWTCHFFLN